jgi:hypothetical protein
MTVKMTQEILAMALGISEGDLSPDQMTLQHLNPYGKPLSSSVLEECKKLVVVIERKRKKKKLSFAKITRKEKRIAKWSECLIWFSMSPSWFLAFVFWVLLLPSQAS